MKKVQLKPWNKLDKLCLISAITKLESSFADQNWVTIGRYTKQLYDTVSSCIDYDQRNDDWFSAKQCAAQYELFLKGSGIRKKKRIDRNTDYADINNALLVSLTQDFCVELQESLATIKEEYAQRKKVIEDIDNNKIDDDTLQEMFSDYVESEKASDVKSKLKSMIDEKNATEHENSSKSLLQQTLMTSEPSTSGEQKNTNVTTSPLLTSLLQSPSPLVRPSSSTSSPTISMLLHSSPPVTITDSTLSKLLETPSLPSTPTITSVETPSTFLQASTPDSQLISINTESKTTQGDECLVKQTEDYEKQEIFDDMSDLEQGVVESEIIIENESSPIKRLTPRRLDLEQVEDEEAEEEVLETVEEIIERVEEAIIETVGENNINELVLSEPIETVSIPDDEIGTMNMEENTFEVIVVDSSQELRLQTRTSISEDSVIIEESIQPKSVEESKNRENKDNSFSLNIPPIADEGTPNKANESLILEISKDTQSKSADEEVDLEVITESKIIPESILIESNSLKEVIDENKEKLISHGEKIISQEINSDTDRSEVSEQTSSIRDGNNEKVITADADSIPKGNGSSSSPKFIEVINTSNNLDEDVCNLEKEGSAMTKTLSINEKTEESLVLEQAISAEESMEQDESTFTQNENGGIERNQSELDIQNNQQKNQSKAEIDRIQSKKEVERNLVKPEIENSPSVSEIENINSLAEVENTECLAEIGITQPLHEIDKSQSLVEIEKCQSLDEVETSQSLVEIEKSQSLTEIDRIHNKEDIELNISMTDITTNQSMAGIEKNRSIEDSECNQSKAEIDRNQAKAGIESTQLKPEINAKEKIFEMSASINEKSENIFTPSVKEPLETLKGERTSSKGSSEDITDGEANDKLLPIKEPIEKGEVRTLVINNDQPTSDKEVDSEINSGYKSEETEVLKSDTNDTIISLSTGSSPQVSICEGSSPSLLTLDSPICRLAQRPEGMEEDTEDIVLVEEKSSRDENVLQGISKTSDPSDDESFDNSVVRSSVSRNKSLKSDIPDGNSTTSRSSKASESNAAEDSAKIQINTEKHLPNNDKDLSSLEETNTDREQTSEHCSDKIDETDEDSSSGVSDSEDTSVKTDTEDPDDSINKFSSSLETLSTHSVDSSPDSLSNDPRYASLRTKELELKSLVKKGMEDLSKAAELLINDNVNEAGKGHGKKNKDNKKTGKKQASSKENTVKAKLAPVESKAEKNIKEKPSKGKASKGKPAEDKISKDKPTKEKQIKENIIKEKPAEAKPTKVGRKSKHLSSVDSKPDSPSLSTTSSDEDRDYRSWKKSILLVYNRLASHKYASVFSKPITENEAPSYHHIILCPMDLSTIKRNIENGVIRTTVEFQRNMLLMVQNAIIYNKYDSHVYDMAKVMGDDMLAQMEVMVQALGDGVPLLGDASEEKQITRARTSKSGTGDTPQSKKRKNPDADEIRPKRNKLSTSSI